MQGTHVDARYQSSDFTRRDNLASSRNKKQPQHLSMVLCCQISRTQRGAEARETNLLWELQEVENTPVNLCSVGMWGFIMVKAIRTKVSKNKDPCSPGL